MSKARTAITVASAAAIAMALPATKAYEGLWLTAKVDTIGTGRPVTACYGETENVRLGQKFTEKQCADLLALKLRRYDAEIGHCITVELPDATRAALVTFAYNVGSAGACKSSAIRKMNAGDIRGGCDALMSWNKAQGRVVRGLTIRRGAERKMCLAGLDAPKSDPYAKCGGARYDAMQFDKPCPVKPVVTKHWWQK